MANFIERNQQRKEIFSSPGNWIALAAWFNERIYLMAWLGCQM
jgi:hypothetical protein